MQLLGRGKQLKDVAVALGVEISTVKTFIERAYAKLRVDNRVDAVMKHRGAHGWCKA